MPHPTSDIERMFDAECRVEALIWIPGLGYGEAFADVFKDDFADYLPEREDAPLYRQLPIMARFRDEGDCAPEDIAESLMLHRTPGFLIQAATPVRRSAGGGSIYSSWGVYHTEWLYAPSEAEIATVCIAWAEAHHVADMTPRKSPAA